MGILARLRLAKIRTMARPNSPDMPPKRTKQVRLGISTIMLIRLREVTVMHSAVCLSNSYADVRLDFGVEVNNTGENKCDLVLNTQESERAFLMSSDYIP